MVRWRLSWRNHISIIFKNTTPVISLSQTAPYDNKFPLKHNNLACLLPSRVIFDSKGLFVRSLLVCIQHLPCSVSFWSILGGSVEVYTKIIEDSCIASLRIKLILACQEVGRWVWPSMNQNRLLFIQTQTLPPHMHHKWKDINGILCKTKTSRKP